MFKITSYIFRQLSSIAFFLTLVLGGSIWLSQSLRFVDAIISKGLPTKTFLTLMVFLLPDLLMIALPAALVIAIMYTYNRLSTDHELVVMRAVGLNHMDLAKPGIALSALVASILYAVSLYFLPVTFRHFRVIEHQVRNTSSLNLIQSGEFVTLGDLTIFVRQRKGNILKDIIVFHNPDRMQPYTITAEHGSVLEEANQSRLALIDGVRHEQDSQTGHPRLLSFDQYVVDLNFPEKPMDDRYRKPHEFFLPELFNPESLAIEESFIPRFRAQAHQRLLSPLQALSFGLIALAVYLCAPVSRRSKLWPPLLTAGICLALQISTNSLIHAASWWHGFTSCAYLLIFCTIMLPFLSLRYEEQLMRWRNR